MKKREKKIENEKREEKDIVSLRKKDKRERESVCVCLIKKEREIDKITVSKKDEG